MMYTLGGRQRGPRFGVRLPALLPVTAGPSFLAKFHDCVLWGRVEGPSRAFQEPSKLCSGAGENLLYIAILYCSALMHPASPARI